LVPIGSITNGFPMAGRATISSDGSKVSATITNPDNNLNEIGLYDVISEEWTILGGIGGSSDGGVSSAWSISRDGSAVVGLGWVISGRAHGVRWTESEGLVDMGSTVPDRSSRANDTNEDGSVIVGWQDGSTGFRQGAVWANGQQTLITDPSNNPVGEVGAVSGNGVWAIGGTFDAWRWSEDTGLIEMESIFSAGWRGSATSTNYDGSIIVGFYRPWPGPPIFGQGFIWTEATGMVNLNDYVTGLGMDDLGITFALPLGMSNDGTAIVGRGLQNGNSVGFLIKLSSAPSNNNCATAIVLSCSDIVSGTTSNASNNGGNDSPDVFYSYTGNSSAEEITISLCDSNTNFNTFLRIFSNCDLTNEIAFNDNFCGNRSEVTFESDGTSTYIIMVEGSLTEETGDYTLQISCEELLSTDDFLFNNIQIYPNPTKDFITISSPVILDKVEIYNTAGQLMISEKTNKIQYSINLSSLPNGIYFAKTIANNTSRTFKIVKK
ncbi:MAG: T9SS type A sorting domain-containing protein, partial [Flavobacteriales bacterium]|nr:T9SS type A sorting domain-containing protein [Flavobacteriales bacterium]